MTAKIFQFPIKPSTSRALVPIAANKDPYMKVLNGAASELGELAIQRAAEALSAKGAEKLLLFAGNVEDVQITTLAADLLLSAAESMMAITCQKQQKPTNDNT